MIRSILFLAFITLVQTVFAQSKELTMRDALLGRYTYLAPDRLYNLQWRDTKHYVYLENYELVQQSVENDEKEVILTFDELKDAATETGFDLNRFPRINFFDENTLEISSPKNHLLFDIQNKKFNQQIEKPEKAENYDYCKSNSTLAYTVDQNLFIKNTESETQITFDKEPGIINGQTVHRNEFGISKGTYWSPNGNFLAFYRKDESMVEDYPLVDFMARQAKHTPVKYPMAGMKSHHVTLGVYDLQTGKTIFLKTGEPKEHYLTNISWGPNEEYIYIAELNRDQNHMQLNQYRISDGEKVKTILEEKSKTYVEPQHPIIFSKKNPEQFYYQTRINGWLHVYIYNVYGKKIKQVTNGDWEVTNFYGFDDNEKNIFVQATKESPIERHIYKINIKNGKATKLTKEPGTHGAAFSSNNKYLIDKWSATEVPSTIDLLSAEGKQIKNIHTSKDNASDFKFGENKLFPIKATDGETDLYCRMILPVDFDPSKKYPVIIYVYGGPHSQLVSNNWHNDARWWQYYMAQKGYIAFTLDNQGTANRGAEFENIIHRQLGVQETEDQMQGLKYLKSLPYVDSERIGVHGWSYGGFMTLNLMLHHADDFKVGVAGGPVVDWHMYEIMYGERYMDHPVDNPKGYEQNTMTNHVDKLKGKLMLIHGVQDKTVVMQHSMKFLRECVKQNKPVDFYAYPTHPHNVRGIDRIHLMEKVSQYFLDYL